MPRKQTAREHPKAARARRSSHQAKRQKQLATSLDQLVQTELIRHMVPDDAEYIFKHALVQDAVYTSLLKHDRKELHRMVAQTLEDECRTDLDEIAARLAQHYAEAGDDAKTLEYAMRAGGHAARIYALSEAITYYALAIEVALRNPKTPSQTLIELYHAHGQALYSNALLEETWANYLEMEARAQERGDLSLKLYSLVERASLRSIFSQLFDPIDARGLAERALRLADELNDRAAKSKILWVRMRALAFQDPPAAVADGEQAVALAAELGLREQYAYALGDSQYAYRLAGRAQDALDALERARALWLDLDHLHMLADNLNQTSSIYYNEGALDRALDFAKQAILLSQRTNNQTQLLLGSVMLGMVYVARGEIDYAVGPMRQALRDTSLWGFGVKSPLLAMLAAALGAPARGIPFLELSLEKLGDMPLGQLFATGQYGQLVRLSLHIGNVSEAERIIREHARYFEQWQQSLTFGGAEHGLLAMLELKLARGDYAAVLDQSRESLNTMDHFGLQRVLPDIRLCRARAYMGLEKFEEAKDVLQQARAEAEQFGGRTLLLQILATLREVKQAHGSDAEAERLRTEARGVVDFILAHTPQEPLPELGHGLRETFSAYAAQLL